MTKEIILLVLSIITLVISAIIKPVILFLTGLFVGWVLQCCCGESVVNVLNGLFGAGRFTVDMLPMFCATVSVIGELIFGGKSDSNKRKESEE